MLRIRAHIHTHMPATLAFFALRQFNCHIRIALSHTCPRCNQYKFQIIAQTLQQLRVCTRRADAHRRLQSRTNLFCASRIFQGFIDIITQCTNARPVAQ